MSFWTDASGRLRLRWRFALFFAALVGNQLMVGVLIGIVLGILAIATGMGPGLFEVPEVKAWYLILGMWPLGVLNIGLVAILRLCLDRRSLWSLGLTRPRFLLGGLGLGLAVSAGPAAVLVALGGYAFAGYSASAQTLVLLPTLALAAFEEELLCRGYLLQNLLEAGRPTAAVLFSSIAFWLMHALNPGVWSSPIPSLNLFLAGAVLALAYLVSGDIWFPTALHYAWNVGQGVVFQLPISGMDVDGVIDLTPTGRLPRWLTGGEFGLESSLLTTAAELGLVAGLGLALGRRWPGRDEVSSSP